MKERYFVATLSNTGPELEAVYWFEKKEDATAEAQRQREFYTKEKIILAKVLNIPKSSVVTEHNQKGGVKA